MDRPSPARQARLASLRLLALGLAWVFAILPWLWAMLAHPQGTLGLVAYDFGIYRDAADSWLGGHGFYLARQLTGPYQITNGDVLYPPTALWLFAPFTRLPTILFWMIPLAGIAYVLYRLRPSMVGWTVIGLLLAWPPSTIELIKGNPVMWVVVAEAFGLIFGWAAVFVLLKPTLAPFALVGLRRPLFWFGLMALALLSLPVISLFPQWLVVVLNSNGGLLYSLRDVPLMLVPVAAYAFRTRSMRASVRTATVPIFAPRLSWAYTAMSRSHNSR